MYKIMTIAAFAVSSIMLAAGSADAAKRTSQYTCPGSISSHHAHSARRHVRHQALSSQTEQ